MKHSIARTTLLSTLLMTLAACGSGSNNSSGTNATTQIDAPATLSLQAFAANPANAAPITVNDPNALRQDLTRIFGTENQEPIAVFANDTAQTVLNRVNR